MRELGRTETIWDSLNPKFTKQFKTTYHFEMVQNFKIALYDRDAKTERLSDHDFLGEASFTFRGGHGNTRVFEIRPCDRSGV